MIAAADRRRHPPHVARAPDGLFHGIPVKALANHHRVGAILLVERQKRCCIALGDWQDRRRRRRGQPARASASALSLRDGAFGEGLGIIFQRLARR